jgi:hypothetical protein
MLAARLPRPATSAHLFDMFIRDRMRGHRYPTATRAVLRRLALAMDEGLTGSLPLTDVDRCGEAALGELQAPLTVLDEVLGSAVVRVEDGRLMFVHEQLARFLTAEDKEMIRIDQRFGSIARTGRWTVPRRIEIASQFCHVTLDFTEAVLGPVRTAVWLR